MPLVERLRIGWRRKLPVLLQTEAAECGMACLAMVASYHGHGVDVAGLRRRFAVSLRGTTLATLMDFAERLGFTTRAVRVELRELSRLQTPCVLHWRFTHFVVLRSADRRGLTIHDPSRGLRRVSPAEADQGFTGVALELWPSSRFERRAPPPTVGVRDVLGRVEGAVGAISQTMVLASALEIFALASPLLLQWVVDHVLVSADRDLLGMLALGFGLLVICEQIIALVRAWVVMHLETTLNLQWHANVFGHLLRLALSYFEKRHLGDVVSRFRSIDAIQRTITTAFIEAFVDGAMCTFLLIVMFCYSPQLATVCLVATGLYAAGRWLAHVPLREARHEQIASAARQESHFIETVRGIRAIKAFGREVERRSAWIALLVEQVNAGLRAQRLSIALRGVNGLLFGLENVVVVYLGATLVLDARFSTGMLLAFVAYKRQFAGRIGTLIDKAAELALLRLHCDRVGDIVLTAPEHAVDAPGRLLAATPNSLDTSVIVRGVRYRYSEHAPYVLDGVDFDIAPGGCVAIVGPSGCGKSTLLQVMIGTLPAAGGDVWIGGVRLRDLGRSLAHTVASVMQNDCLFAGSIADNISFFDASADQQRIEHCARVAAIHDDIVALPMAYNTLVGFLGSTLSAGQQQRVLIARALYHSPSILLLDEATSHLDVQLETLILRALAELSITRIIVAHRPETVATADRVFRMERGRIAPDEPDRGAARHPHATTDFDPNALPLVLRASNNTARAVLGSLGC